MHKHIKIKITNEYDIFEEQLLSRIKFIDPVVKYIDNQEQHHQKQTFKAEYLNFLNKFEVDYKTEDLFEFYDF